LKNGAICSIIDKKGGDNGIQYKKDRIEKENKKVKSGKKEKKKTIKNVNPFLSHSFR